ncbi:SDR family NAD(P)-dependent oxidoreductase [Autumnicola psychrophila]|uniref:SDR family NAD(P)-dependent oxidoreductase n=1 Tax=Autumnicola psychrophila TaxID=3075592 RepID=A0ABU3DVF2_9FLAO|nr:SDR family NAD(P)-dependent oxidoreductase [Zunongwangia sp. F225]MDT0687655.1 SDR family NAD(P)-dependent oxidoreductase [Zunongwangia sp. F225]
MNITRNGKPGRFALITGASRGLGKAFAFDLAKRQRNVILVSLPGEGLEQVAEEVRKAGCEAHFYETDLTVKQNVLDLTAWINNNFRLDILINNAGFGGNKRFLEAGADYIDKMIELNVKATSIITHQLLPNLLKSKKSYVLNVSSMAAMSPIAYKTVYPASKAFVHSFTRSLQSEFSDKGVFFSVLNPGPIKTNGDVSSRIDKQGMRTKILVLPPEEIARLSIDQLFNGKNVIKLNWAHRFGWFLLHVLPVSVKMSILSNNALKEIENAD